MKVSITYLYTILRYGCPPTLEGDFKALEEIHRMGFRFLEMEGLGRRHAEGVWKRRKDLKQCLADNDVHVYNFNAIDGDLVSLDRKTRKAAYERFKRTAELATYVGAETMQVVSHPPPVQYDGKKPYALGEDYTFKPVGRVTIPRGFSWQKVWDALVESCQFTADVARQYRRTLILEPRVGDVVCSVDSVLRLIADVGRGNFKATFDTAHSSAQRESIPLSLMKLKGRFAGLHISDNDPANAEHLPVGEGTIDWREFFRVLKAVGYDGYVGLDFGRREWAAKDYQQSLKYVQRICQELKIPVEW